ncbi:MAG: hypothetical protein KatS3mg037_0305 [Ignavibacterium sp.]|nr:glycosyltransferase [Ignavibacterium sp.]BDQ01730.1 MAG: hypothetical protein KatS3mg037_0305 [Ignavibacterium sp.]
MKISIITVTKNNKAGLLRAIESVRSQTYKNVEHIVVDGLSTDGTVEILKQVPISGRQNDDSKGDLSSRTNVTDFKDFSGASLLRNDRTKDDILRQAQDDILREAPRSGRQDDDSLGDVSSHTNVSLPNEGKAFLLKVEDTKISPPTSRGRNDSTKDEEAKVYNLQFISEADEGIYDAINKGIRMATGDVIGLLHSDDFFADEFVLERYAEAFQQDERLKEKDFIQDKRLKRNDQSIQSSRMNVNPPTEDKDCPPMVGDVKISPPTSRGRNDRIQDDKGHTQDYQSPSTNNRQPNIDAVYSDLVYVGRKLDVGERKFVEDKEKTISQPPTPNTLYPIPYTIIRTWKVVAGRMTIVRAMCHPVRM